jgi:hypothetical protein
MERQQLLVEIDCVMSVDPSEVPEESKFLLEIDFWMIRVTTTERQSYWVHVVCAAVKAGRQAARYKHRGRPAPPTGAMDGKQQADWTAPPLGFSSSDDRGELKVAAGDGCKRRAGRGEYALSDGYNKRRKPD